MALFGFQNWMLALIPSLPLLGFFINAGIALYASRADKRNIWKPSALFGCLFPFISFLFSVLGFFALKQNPSHLITTGPLFSWLQTSLVHIDFAFMLDPLSSLMILIVTGVGTLIHVYSIGYMKGDNSFSRYFSYLNLFLFFMLLLVLGDNLLVLFVGWEGVGLCSYLLIGFWFTDPEKAAAGKKAFIVNRIGDFGFLIGLFLILFAFTSQSQSTDLSFLNYTFMEAHRQIFAPFAVIITLCLFMGATGKSAQIPLYVWLPDAMAGPTPVSALIHAATMVTAGIYMVVRLYFLFELAPLTLEVIASIGLATALLAALIGLTQTDIKKVLAYSTVSQLGFMFLALGAQAPIASVFHLMTHAFFKACLFLCAGSVIHAVHDQDIRNMGGLAKKMPITFGCFLVSTLAISGVPPFSGFFSKDEILWMTYLNAPPSFYYLALLTAGITAFYMFRLLAYTFLGKTRHPHPEHIHESPPSMSMPLIILAFLALVGGFIGVPAVLGGNNYLHHWLSSFAPHAGGHEGSHSLELTLMGVSTGWALFMGLLSLFLYTRNLQWAASLKRKLNGLYTLVERKFLVDELYQSLIVQPLFKFSQGFLWKVTDEKLVDGFLVKGLGGATILSARVVSWFQTGVLGHYLLYIWTGLILLLILTVR